MTILKNFFGFLKAEGIGKIDPLMLRVPKFTPMMRSVIDASELDSICRELDEYEFWQLRKLVMFRLLWDTGMRVSELCDLNLIHVEEGKNFTMIATKKSNSYRWVVWSKETHELLCRYLGTRLDISNTSPLFISHGEHARISTRSVERWMNELCKKARIMKKLTPHSFRHAKAHEMLRRGANVKEIQIVLGHSEDNPRAAFQYLKLNKEESVKIAQKYV